MCSECPVAATRKTCSPKCAKIRNKRMTAEWVKRNYKPRIKKELTHSGLLKKLGRHWDTNLAYQRWMNANKM